MKISALSQDQGRFSPTRLKELRLHYGFTQTQMAEELGFSRGGYLGWENNISVPSVNLITSLLNRFGMSSFFYVMDIIDEIDGGLSKLNTAEGRALAIAVEECFERVALRYNAGDVFEMTVALLALSPGQRQERLKGIEAGLLQFKPQLSK